MEFSPDGQRLLTRIGGAKDSAWLYDIRRETLSRLTSGGNTLSASWSPDGRRVMYSMVGELGSIAADGSGEDRVLYRDEHQKGILRAVPGTEWVLFQTIRPGTGVDIWQLSLKTSQAEPWLNTRFNEAAPRVSPDGKWVAYASNETGRTEVYVRPFQGAGGRSQVSRAGGGQPVWSQDGRELFFLESRAIMSAVVRAGETFEADPPRRLFGPPGAGVGATFDVTPDGKRFVTTEPVASPSITHVNLVAGWFADLTRGAAVR